MGDPFVEQRAQRVEVTYRIALPNRADRLDIVDANSTGVQHVLRRGGLASYEPPTMATLLTLFEQEADSLTFFDVGANMGLYSLVCAAMFDPVAVHAFEPTPATAAVARAAARANQLNIEVVEVALSDINGTATLHLSDNSDSSNSLAAGFKVSSTSVTVPVVRLDDHVASSMVAPTVMKIDVETHEPAVLAGAAETIAEHRPFIVIEVLRRSGRDHGVEINDAMGGLGYSCYELSADPDWVSRPTVTGAAKTTNRDWLLAPAPLPDDFAERWSRWTDALAACGPETNPRVPLWLTLRAVLRRGGLSEAAAVARRFLAGGYRERSGRSR